jgi:hypothetical protein
MWEGAIELRLSRSAQSPDRGGAASKPKRGGAE